MNNVQTHVGPVWLTPDKATVIEAESVRGRPAAQLCQMGTHLCLRLFVYVQEPAGVIVRCFATIPVEHIPMGPPSQEMPLPQGT